MSMFSESRYQNVTIILVCGGCGSHFQNGLHDFSMSHISANNIDGKLICVCLMSGPHNTNMVNIGLYRDVWIAAIGSSRTRVTTLSGVKCNTSQLKLRSLRVNYGMGNVICIVT